MAKRHNVTAATIRNWVKNAGFKLPTRYKVTGEASPFCRSPKPSATPLVGVASPQMALVAQSPKPIPKQMQLPQPHAITTDQSEKNYMVNIVFPNF